MFLDILTTVWYNCCVIISNESVVNAVDNLSEKFDVFVESCHNDLLKYCIAHTGNAFDADDVLNEALFRLWKVWGVQVNFPDDQNRGWLFNAIKYILLENKHKKYRTVLCGDKMLEILKYDRSISRFEEEMQYQQYIKDIMSELDDQEKEIFTMVFIHKLPYDVISKKTGIKSTTLRSIISRMRKRLKKKIKF